MALSKGSLHITSLELEAINDALRRIREELDELHGLRGTASVYGGKTLAGVPLRLVDGNGTLVHAWGTKE